MTSFAFILGVVPLLTSTGAGSEMRRVLGVAVFSGMLGVTLFGIFLTPVFFYVIEGFIETPLFSSARARQLTRGFGVFAAFATLGLPWLLGQLLRRPGRPAAPVLSRSPSVVARSGDRATTGAGDRATTASGDRATTGDPAPAANGKAHAIQILPQPEAVPAREHPGESNGDGVAPDTITVQRNHDPVTPHGNGAASSGPGKDGNGAAPAREAVSPENKPDPTRGK
jgi:hypothetical protein